MAIVRRMWAFRAIAASALALGGATMAQAMARNFDESCRTLSGRTIAGATIGATSSEQGRFAGGDQSFTDLPAFCRVQARIARPDGGYIELEVWLPETWNGRYLQAGNSGFAGSIAYRGLATGVRDGFAVANSDGGHQSVGSDMRWAIDRPGRVADFGHLALHDIAIAAKAIVTRYYGRAAAHAYFAGCSDGGREALMSLQRYPDQFDGWLVGAPENDFTGELTAELVLAQASRGRFGSITQTQLDAISKLALAHCDALDGTEDGVIEDPRRCGSSLALLACNGQTGTACLDPGQIAAIDRARKDWRDPSGTPDIPGLAWSIGTEAAPGQWTGWMSHIAGASIGGHEDYAQQFFGTFLHRDAALDLATLDPGDAWRDARQKTSADVDAIDPDLSRQRALHRKVIQYHGWADVGIPAQFTLAYYGAVQKAMGGSVEDFYRLFMVPGMGHCGGGTGANAFGGFGDLSTPFEPDRNLLAALVRWVERGKAPDRVVATHYRDNDPAKGADRTHPLCVFPRQARYDGKGKIDDASSYHCS